MAIVLIIEDDPKLFVPLRRILEAEGGKDIIVAKDCRKGLQKALKNHPDLIILDSTMPKKDGHKMLAELRQDKWGSGAQVLMLTDDPSIENLNNCLQLGVKHYFIKTELSLSQLCKLVKSGIEKNEKPA